MNSKLLTIIFSLVITSLLYSFTIYSTSKNFRVHQQQLQVTGNITSSLGLPLKLSLQILLNNKAQTIQSDDKGLYQLNIQDLKVGNNYTAQVTTNQLILGYIYQNPITTFSFILQDKLQLPSIILKEGGFGQLQITGKIGEPNQNLHLQLQITQNSQQLQTHSISRNGVFTFNIYGIKSLPIQGVLSIQEKLETYQQYSNDAIKLEGVTTIIQLNDIILKQSTSCQLNGCQKCLDNNQQCQICQYGYKLTQNQTCEFGYFIGSGSTNAQIINYGQLQKIVGQLVDKNLKPITDQFICLESNNICIATGGTNHLGYFEIEYLGFIVGIQHVKFVVQNKIQQDLLLSENETLLNLGIIIIY